MIEVKCDSCGKKIKTKWFKIRLSNEVYEYDICEDCLKKGLKTEEIFEEATEKWN